MPEDVTEIPTPEPSGETATHMAEKCLEFVEAYRKGSRTPLDKATTIQNITEVLTSGSPQQFPKSEVNDALGTYLGIIGQHDKSISTAETRSETLDENNLGSKRAGSFEPDTSTGKRQRSDDSDFPWTIREGLSGPGICEDLQKTLDLLRIYARDVKRTKSSLLTSANAPQFPNSEWSNIIIGAMVDLDHIISGSFAVSSDNQDTEVVGTIQFKFGAAKAVKQVKTSGDWFIAWGCYTQVASFTFPHQKSELQTYGSQILSLFTATSPDNHASVIALDKAIRVRVGERRDLLLTDHAQFNDLRLYWLNPIGAGKRKNDPKGKTKPKSDFKCEDPCDRWNRGVCRSKASECKYKHICQECRGPHRINECRKGRKGAV
jgi:hypothetical protein